MTDEGDIAIRRGSGNLYADLGYVDSDTHFRGSPQEIVSMAPL